MTNEPTLSKVRVLHSWKEIASYTGRGVRTIQRYEAQYGFPVRRPSGSPRSAVLAFTQEVDEWLARSPMRERTDAAVGHNSGELSILGQQHVRIDALYQKARLGHSRAEAMQRRMGEMSALVARMTLRVKEAAEYRSGVSRSRLLLQTQPSPSENADQGIPGGEESHCAKSETTSCVNP